MQRRRIGSLEVSIVGLGTNNFGLYLTPDEVAPVVDAALGHGINFIDTADVYRDAEEKLARGPAGRGRQGSGFRSPVRISPRVHPG